MTTKHYIAYHNTEKMNYSFRTDADSNSTEFDIVTTKKVNELNGSVIWLISGEGKPRDYRLEYWFYVDEVKSTVVGKKRKYRVSGTDGINLNGIPLNHAPWFKHLLDNQLNFRSGFQRIANEHISNLCSIATASKFNTPGPEADQAEESNGPAARRKYVRDQPIRDSAIVTEVKRRHDFTCQVCGVRLQTPAGPYAQCAHIRPLGSPHHGPDKIGNVLCLCPNDHLLFDTGSFSIRDDMRFIDREGSLRVVKGHKIDLAHLAYHRKLSKLPEA